MTRIKKWFINKIIRHELTLLVWTWICCGMHLDWSHLEVWMKSQFRSWVCSPSGWVWKRRKRRTWRTGTLRWAFFTHSLFIFRVPPDVAERPLLCRSSPKLRWSSIMMSAAATCYVRGPTPSGRQSKTSLTGKLRSWAWRTATSPCLCPRLLWRRRRPTSQTLPQR